MSPFYLCKHVKVSHNCEYVSAAISLYKKVFIKRCLDKILDKNWMLRCTYNTCPFFVFILSSGSCVGLLQTSESIFKSPRRRKLSAVRDCCSPTCIHSFLHAWAWGKEGFSPLEFRFLLLRLEWDMNCTYLLSFQMWTHSRDKPKRYLCSLWMWHTHLAPRKSHHMAPAFTQHYPRFNSGQAWPGGIIIQLPTEWMEPVPHGSDEAI